VRDLPLTSQIPSSLDAALSSPNTGVPGHWIIFGRGSTQQECFGVYYAKAVQAPLIVREIGRLPQYCKLFGPVSISHTFPKLAKDLLIYFYMTYFGGKEGMVTHKNRYMLSRQELEEYRQIIKGDDYTGDFRTLKQHLAHLGVTVPTLYKQYSELCEPGGVTFLDFGVDVDFENCVDGFILVYVEKVKEQKRKRYMGEE